MVCAHVGGCVCGGGDEEARLVLRLISSGYMQNISTFSELRTPVGCLASLRKAIALKSEAELMSWKVPEADVNN